MRFNISSHDALHHGPWTVCLWCARFALCLKWEAAVLWREKTQRNNVHSQDRTWGQRGGERKKSRERMWSKRVYGPFQNFFKWTFTFLLSFYSWLSWNIVLSRNLKWLPFITHSSHTTPKIIVPTPCTAPESLYFIFASPGPNLVPGTW